MRAIKQLHACCCNFVVEIISKYGADEESLKKAAAEKTPEFVADVAKIMPKAMEEVASMPNEIIPVLADNVNSYLASLPSREYARLVGGRKKGRK